jgi:peptidyl-prolyl cis-trans isomerase C
MSYFIARHLRRTVSAAVLALCVAVPAAQGDDEVVATVNGAEITQRDVAFASEELAPALENVPQAQHRQFIVNYLTDLHLLSQAASAADIEAESEFAERMEYMTKRTLMEIYLARHGEAAATEEEARRLYDNVIGQVEPETEVSARHILVESEDEASEIIARLEAGEDFAELAQEASIDPGSAPRGGDLGYFTRERMIPEFADAAFALEAGETSAPVESQFGWHVILVEDRRDSEPPSFEEVEDELMTMLTRQAQRDLVMELREGAEIVIEDESVPDLLDPGQMQPAPDVVQ